MSLLLFLLLLDLHGRVVDASSGQPIPKATILHPAGHRVFTDAEGRFTVPNLPAGPQRLQLHARGYHQGSLRAGQPSGETRYFDLTPSTANSTFTAYLHQGARLRGRVVDSDGDPIERLQVMLLDHENGRWEFASVTASAGDGSWEFYGLPPGRYAIGLPGLIEEVGPLREGEERSALSVRLPAPAPVIVELNTPGFGSAIWSATLQRRLAPFLPVELTPQLQVYPLHDRILGPNVPPGDYTLRLFEKVPAGLRTLLEQPLTVGRQEEPQPLRPGRFSPLALRTRNFLPGTRLRLAALAPGNQTDLTYSLDASGSLTVPSLSPGNYRLSATAADDTVLEVSPSQFDMRDAPLTLAIANQGPVQKETPRLPLGRAAFFVLTAEGYREDQP